MRKQIGVKEITVDGKVYPIRVFSPRASRKQPTIRIRERMGDWQLFAVHPNVRVVSQPMAPKS